MNPLTSLVSSRKFLVVLLTQAIVAALTYYGKVDNDTAVKVAAALVGAWMASHAYQESNKGGTT